MAVRCYNIHSHCNLLSEWLTCLLIVTNNFNKIIIQLRTGTDSDILWFPLFYWQNSRTFPGLSRTPMKNFPGPVRSPRMFKYKAKTAFTYKIQTAVHCRKFSIKQNAEFAVQNSDELIYIWSLIFFIWTTTKMHDFQGYFLMTFQVLKFQRKIQDFPGGMGTQESKNPMFQCYSHERTLPLPMTYQTLLTFIRILDFVLAFQLFTP